MDLEGQSGNGSLLSENWNIIAVLASLLLNLTLPILMRLSAGAMYPFFIIYYVWAATYALFLFFLLKLERASTQPLIRNMFHLLAVFLGIAIFRSAFFGLETHISLDSLWYLDFGKFMKMGRMPYTEFYFPYPPIFAYFIYGISILAPTVDSFRLLATIMDIFVAFFIWKIASRHMDKRRASTATLAYAFLPVSIIESGWNGHFEPLATAFMLIGIWFMLNQRQKLTGVFLALGAVTKIYPALLIPFALFYIQERKPRIEFILSVVLTGLLSLLPLTMFGASSSSEQGNGSSTPSGFLLSQLEFVFNWNFPGIIITALTYFGIILGLVLIVRHLAKGSLTTASSLYDWASLLVGLILTLMGIIAAVYPLSPLAKSVYWRYPVDIGVVRGISSASIGVLIFFRSFQAIRTRAHPEHSTESTIFLYSGAIMLLLSISRDVFYGWYLLWSIPLFLLLRNRRVGLVIILALLLIYPSYTHDNFTDIGYAEQRIWNGRFQSSNQWAVYVNSSASSEPGAVSASFSAKEEAGYFKFDASAVNNRSALSNVSIIYTRYVTFDVNTSIDFAVRASSSWDPTFGSNAFISMIFEARNGTGDVVNGTIIPKTSLFTNLTSTLWRYSFSSHRYSRNMTVFKLQVIIYPRQIVASEYIIEEMYTTYSGLLNPVYFLIIPSLVALSLTGFALLHEQLRFFDKREELNS